MQIEIDTSTLSRCLAEQERSSGRRIDFVPVVYFEDLDIEFIAERRCDLLYERGENIDSEAHIAGLDDAGVARGGFNPGIPLCIDAGRADHMDDARLGR